MNCGIPMCFLAVLLGFLSIVASQGEDKESELRKKLLEGYDKTISPLYSNKIDTKEIIFISLNRIRDLDETTSTLTIEAVIGMGWSDERLSWNKTEYDIRYVGFPTTDIWTPRLWILNHVKPKESVSGDSRALAFNHITWLGKKYAVHTSCVPNLKYFPFDKQNCDIEIASITQSGEMMKLNITVPNSIYRRYLSKQWMLENTRWKCLNHSLKKIAKTLKDEQVVDVELLSLEIQRTTPLIAMAIMTPSVMSIVLVLSGFWISPTCPVRIGISVTGIFVSMTTLFTLGRVLPVTGTVTPIIVEYCATSLVLVMLFTIHTCLVSLAVRSTTPFPFPYFVLLERLPGWVHRLLGSDDVMPKETSMNQVLLYSEITEPDIPQDMNKTAFPSTNNSDENAEPVANPLTDIHTETPEATGEWLKPMIIFDKICFYVYIIITVLYVVSVIIEE